jgi:hypothetical protein
MSQHDYVIGNDTAANVRADINTALLAIASNNSGASAPATTYANQWWYDSTNDILKIRAEANDAWISVAKLDQTLDQFFPIVGGVEVTATGTELNFVDGVTSAIQAQIDAKAPLTGTGTSGTWPISITGDAATTDGKSFGTFTAAGGIAYATSTTALAAIGAGTSGQALVSGGAGAPTWSTISSGGMTLLGTLTTTSGTTQTLSSLTLTSYNYILIDYYNIGATTTGWVYVKGNAGANAIITANANQPSGLFGKAVINLSNSFVIFDSVAGTIGTVSGGAVGTGETSVSTSTTSLVFSPTGVGTFNKGVVKIYGVK